MTTLLSGPTTSGAALLLAEVERHGCRVVLRDDVPTLTGNVKALPAELMTSLKQYRSAIVVILGPTPGRRVLDATTGEVLWTAFGPEAVECHRKLAEVAAAHPGKLLALEHRKVWLGGEEWQAFAWTRKPEKEVSA